MNPLLKPFDLAPFASIEDGHFKPAFIEAITQAKNEIDNIIENSEAPTFGNTISALDFSGQHLGRISSIFFNLNSANTNKVIQETAKEVSPLLTEHKNDIMLNAKLFGRVAAVYSSNEMEHLTKEEQRLTEKWYKNFVRNGSNLGEEAKNELRSIDVKLAKLQLEFGENLLAEVNNYSLHITDKSDLAGIPESAREMAKQKAESQLKEGWVFTLEYPSYIPFMKYAKNRNLRQELQQAFGSKGFHGDELDNQGKIKEITSLRHQRAKLLGYQSHAHFVLEERMAESPGKVMDFLNELLEKSWPKAKSEFGELAQFAKGLDGIEDLQSFDSAYYSEKLKQERFSLDDEKLKPYFKLENVIDGAFEVAEKLFSLKFEEDTNIEKYHEEVKTYRVLDSEGNFKAIFYADFHPRAGKRSGAWMTSYKPQCRVGQENIRPHISIVCNFSPSTPTKPSLLTFNEVTTLFHEFGHALHGILADTTYPSLSGTSVFWDFVELPSQLMENWCYEEEALKLFARHFGTGERIPMEYIEKIKELARFQQGMATVRQLSFGFLDMAWHSQKPEDDVDVKKFEQKILDRTSLFPPNENTCMSTAFAHIFQGGYSSGYYSYKWAEVLDADAFSLFKEKGIFDSTTAKSFKDNVLSKGGTEKPMTLYKRFRGQEPSVEALLQRAGLIEEGDFSA